LTIRPDDQITAFRLSGDLLKAIDSVYKREDLTRSQFYRRFISSYINQHNNVLNSDGTGFVVSPQTRWGLVG
jgi:metal-responsive CopG/Arc/MetJ family transcriptional regulator